MSKKVIALLAALLIVILVLTGFVIKNAVEQQRIKEIFINEIYFLLTDISEEISKQEPMSISHSAKLHDDLRELDLRCIIHSQETNADFNYPRPGIFELIDEYLMSGEYDQGELQELAADIQLVVSELSDQSGTAENTRLTYKELNVIFHDFSSKWEMLINKTERNLCKITSPN